MKPTQEVNKPMSDPSAPMPVIADDLPIMYEDEGQDEMGESTPHTSSDHILSMAITEHLRPRLDFQVFSNLNLYYHPVDRRAYVSPDVMVVQTSKPLPERLNSYRIGPDRPVPMVVIEILSRRSAQQQDLTNKPEIYAMLGVSEFILVDPTAEFLIDRLMLKRRGGDGEWDDEQDRDGGVTSRLGFRILIEEDELPRVIDVATGRRYLRPREAHEAVQSLQDEVRKLEAKIKRLTKQNLDVGDKT